MTTEFNLPVRLDRAARGISIVIGTDDGAGPFVEYHRFGGTCIPASAAWSE